MGVIEPNPSYQSSLNNFPLTRRVFSWNPNKSGKFNKIRILKGLQSLGLPFSNYFAGISTTCQIFVGGTSLSVGKFSLSKEPEMACCK
mgnify:CR=1 FL=1